MTIVPSLNQIILCPLLDSLQRKPLIRNPTQHHHGYIDCVGKDGFQCIQAAAVRQVEIQQHHVNPLPSEEIQACVQPAGMSYLEFLQVAHADRLFQQQDVIGVVFNQQDLDCIFTHATYLYTVVLAKEMFRFCLQFCEKSGA